MKRLVLIVDDNAVNTKLMRALLESGGYEVAAASHAGEARAALEQSRPALILMDLQMPGIDGYTFTRELRRTEGFKEIPIVAVTASAMRGDDLRALEAGCTGYIPKPIDTRAFLGTIARFLPAAEAA